MSVQVVLIPLVLVPMVSVFEVVVTLVVLLGGVGGGAAAGGGAIFDYRVGGSCGNVD